MRIDVFDVGFVGTTKTPLYEARAHDGLIAVTGTDQERIVAEIIKKTGRSWSISTVWLYKPGECQPKHLGNVGEVK